MIFIYFIALIVAYSIFWYLAFPLLGLPGMGLTALLLSFMPKAKSIIIKILIVPLAFFTYLFNKTLIAFIWAFIVGIITFQPMSRVNHPWLYFVFGCFAAVFIGAPSGETDFSVSIQTLLLYICNISRWFADFKHDPATPYEWGFYEYSWMISGILFGIAFLIGAILAIVVILQNAGREELSIATVQYRESMSSIFKGD